MGTGLQGAGRPVGVINDSDRPDLTHSITLRLTHHQLIYHTDTWQPHPRLTLPHLATNPGQEQCFLGPQTTFWVDCQQPLSLKLILVSLYS